MAEPSENPGPGMEILVNERAGLGGSATAALETRLREVGLESPVRGIVFDEFAAALAAAATRAGIVPVCGGDGTMMAAADVLAGGGAIMAPIPTGTLNHFSRRLGIESLSDAAEAIRAGFHVRMPVGVVDDRVFLNTATFGLYADVVRQRERLRPWLTKWPAAALAIAGKLMVMRRLWVTLEVDGERLERFTPLVWVGIGWGSFPRVHAAAERRSRPDLEIVVVRPPGRFGVVGLGLRFILHLLRGGRPVEDPALEVIHARSLVIRAAGRVGVTMDGEVLRLRTPIFIGVVDDALRVVAHPPEPEGESAEGG